MKRNLELLGVYRKKLAIIFAIIFTTLIMAGIFFDRIFFEQNIAKTENLQLKRKMEWIKNLKESEFFDPSNDENTAIIRSSENMKNVKIFSENEIFFDSFELTIPDFSFINGQSVVIDQVRFLADSAELDGKKWNILIAVESASYSENLWWLAVQLFVAGGFIGGFVLFLSFHLVDISFRPTRKMVENMEDFTGNINHEFKTLLAEIISSLELAKITKNYEKSVDNAISSSKKINMILDSLSHTLFLVNDDYRKETVNLWKIFDENMREFDREIISKKLKIIKKYAGKKEIFAKIDRESLSLIFRNILKNAIRYSHQEGEIEIEIGKNFFKITDHGVGIATENLDKVFGRYFREDYNREWSGIGLALAKKIADRYGWEIKIESKKHIFTSVSCFFENELGN